MLTTRYCLLLTLLAALLLETEARGAFMRDGFNAGMFVALSSCCCGMQ